MSNQGNGAGVRRVQIRVPAIAPMELWGMSILSESNDLQFLIIQNRKTTKVIKLKTFGTMTQIAGLQMRGARAA